MTYPPQIGFDPNAPIEGTGHYVNRVPSTIVNPAAQRAAQAAQAARQMSFYDQAVNFGRNVGRSVGQTLRSFGQLMPSAEEIGRVAGRTTGAVARATPAAAAFALPYLSAVARHEDGRAPITEDSYSGGDEQIMADIAGHLIPGKQADEVAEQTYINPTLLSGGEYQFENASDVLGGLAGDNTNKTGIFLTDDVSPVLVEEKPTSKAAKKAAKKATSAVPAFTGSTPSGEALRQASKTLGNAQQGGMNWPMLLLALGALGGGYMLGRR